MRRTASGTVELTEKELPISCPLPKSPKWNLHPRVFLPLAANSPEHSCPYCGTRYILVDSERADSSANPTSKL